MQKSTILSKLSLLDWVLPILIFFLLSRTPSDADMWWHLRAGKEMWDSGQILLTDTFSHTKTGMPWVNAFWLSEIFLYAAYLLGEFFGLALFVSIMGMVTFGFIYFRVRAEAPFAGALIIILAATAAAPTWGPRPQLFSFFFLAVLDFILSRPNQNPLRLVIIIGALFALWANVHGGWIWGILLLLAHLVGDAFTTIQQQALSRNAWRQILRQAAPTATAIFAIGLNPNGLALWQLPFHTVDVSMQIQEWLSPDFHRSDFHPMLWLIFLLIFSLNFSERRMSWAEIFKIIGFTYLTFVSQRNIAPFSILIAPVLALTAHSALQKFGIQALTRKPARNQTGNILNAILIITLFGISLLRLDGLSTTALAEKEYPGNAVAWLKNQKIDGLLFNSYNWGGYLAWKLPEKPVYIDGRADLYGDEIVTEWHSIVSGASQGMNALQKRNIQIILLEPTWPIVPLLPAQGWREAYRDETAIIFIR